MTSNQPYVQVICRVQNYVPFISVSPSSLLEDSFGTFHRAYSKSVPKEWASIIPKDEIYVVIATVFDGFFDPLNIPVSLLSTIREKLAHRLRDETASIKSNGHFGYGIDFNPVYAEDREVINGWVQYISDLWEANIATIPGYTGSHVEGNSPLQAALARLEKGGERGCSSLSREQLQDIHATFKLLPPILSLSPPELIISTSPFDTPFVTVQMPELPNKNTFSST